MKCFECGDSGHVSYDCPNKAAIRQDQARADGKPLWCGTCDQRTRLILIMTPDGEKMRRCDCHPESHKLPAQFTRCPTCRAATYAWDTASDCTRHQPVGAHLPYQAPAPTPPRPDGTALQATAARQASEARAARIAIDPPQSQDNNTTEG